MTKNRNNLHTFVILAYQESPFLEQCIKSILNQHNASQTIIATTTPNHFIDNLAQKYNLKIVTGKHTNIGGDFDFALHSANTPLVTIAHQDDLYDKFYSDEIISAYHKHPNSSIIFTDYYEIRNSKKTYTNLNLKIKRLLLLPLKISHGKSKFTKRSALRFGCSICCPAVTFVTNNCPSSVFSSDYKCDVDWHAWETLSKKHFSFTYISKPLMGHRISESSTTSNIIKHGLRAKEDYEIFKRFWPKPIAKLFTKMYHLSEKSNSLDKD